MSGQLKIVGKRAMAVRLDDPEYWQARAEEARSCAEQIADYGSKAVLFRIAVDYERVAARAAALAKASMPEAR
jgi:hypothetical protein